MVAAAGGLLLGIAAPGSAATPSHTPLTNVGLNLALRASDRAGAFFQVLSPDTTPNEASSPNQCLEGGNSSEGVTVKSSKSQTVKLEAEFSETSLCKDTRTTRWHIQVNSSTAGPIKKGSVIISVKTIGKTQLKPNCRPSGNMTCSFSNGAQPTVTVAYGPHT
jgi:hypothetical protein